MWIVRELLRFVGRIAIALLIAIVIAEARALISGGDTLPDVPHRAACSSAASICSSRPGPGASLGGQRMNDTSWWLTPSLRLGDARSTCPGRR